MLQPDSSQLNVDFLQKLPRCYETGYFQGDTLLHHEATFRTSGYCAQHLPYDILSDSYVALLILLVSFLGIQLLRSSSTFRRQQRHEFTLPPRTDATALTDSSRLGLLFTILTTLLLTTLSTLIYYYWKLPTLTTVIATTTLYRIAGTYALCIVACFLLRQVLSSFINWIFFEKIKRQIWQQNYSFLTLQETLLLLPLTLIALYLPLPPDEALLVALIPILLTKFLLLYRSKKIFFPKYHGFFHLLLYLCALEVTPLLALWVVLSVVTDQLTVQI